MLNQRVVQGFNLALVPGDIVAGKAGKLTVLACEGYKHGLLGCNGKCINQLGNNGFCRRQLAKAGGSGSTKKDVIEAQ